PIAVETERPFEVIHTDREHGKSRFPACSSPWGKGVAASVYRNHISTLDCCPYRFSFAWRYQVQIPLREGDTVSGIGQGLVNPTGHVVQEGFVLLGGDPVAHPDVDG